MKELNPERYTKTVIENKVRQHLVEHKKELMNDLIKEKKVGVYKEAKAEEIHSLMVILMDDEGYKENEAWEIVVDRYLKV
jgi:23S rRNA maturation mini-RNase III